MAFIKLADIQYLPSSVGTLYANPSSTTTAIKTIFLHNTNTTAETVELYIVPDSSGSLGTPTSAHRIFSRSLAANESYEISPSYPFILTDTNDALAGNTTTASKVTVIVLGDKE